MQCFFDTTVSANCDFLFTVHLIYTIEYGFWQIRNGVIMLNSIRFLIILGKVLSDRSNLETSSTVSFSKVITKQSRPLFFLNLFIFASIWWTNHTFSTQWTPRQLKKKKFNKGLVFWLNQKRNLLLVVWCLAPRENQGTSKEVSKYPRHCPIWISQSHFSVLAKFCSPVSLTKILSVSSISPQGSYLFTHAFQ